MIVPTKFTSIDESALGKAPIVLEAFDDPMSVHALYQLVENRFEDAAEFLYTLDVLYILESIQVDSTTGLIEKC